MNNTKIDIRAALIADAKIYSKYVETELEFLHTKSIKQPFQCLRVCFGKEHFMHLVGVYSKTYSAAGFFEACITNNIALSECHPAHSSKNRDIKILLFPSLFQFENSKLFRVGEKDLSTPLNDFHWATGNEKGTLGFDTRDLSFSSAFPVTLIDQPIFHYCSEPHKIIAVVQHFPKTKEHAIIYEIKNGIYSSLTINHGK